MLPIPNQKQDAPHLIYRVPYEFYAEFNDAPYEAMRDLLAIPAVVKDALFPNPKVLEDRVSKTRIDPVNEENLYKWINSRIDSPKTFNIFNEHLIRPDNYTAYFIHIDLAISEDATGMTMVHRDVSGKFITDFIVAVESAKCVDKRIPIGKMKYLAIYLKYNLGFNVSKVTYDGFQSAESIQELIENGIDAKVQSVDRTPAPYDTLRDIIHSDQLEFYDYISEPVPSSEGTKNRSLIRELLNLTKDSKSGRVDHISKGSKDLSDSLAGAIFICAAEDFEYRGVNSIELEKETMSDTNDPYIWDGYKEHASLNVSDIQQKMIEDEMDKQDDEVLDEYELYGEEF